MQRLLATTLAAILLVTGFAAAQGLDGKTITVKLGASNTPVTVAWPGDAPKNSVDVVENGKAYPATVRDGELVFIPEGDKGSDHTYTVRVTNQKREPRVVIKQKGDESVLDVTIDGQAFTSYHYNIDKPVSLELAKKLKPEMTDDLFKSIDTNKDGVITGVDVAGAPSEKECKLIASLVNRKPFLWPVLGEGNVTVTRNWPMGESEGPTDHEHQKSFWTAHGNVNGADLWTETDGGKSGYQMVEDVTSGSGDAYGWIVSKQTWQDVNHKPLVSEVREYRFYATPASARIFDVTVTFTADRGDVVFGDTKEGGIVAFRIRPEMNEKGGTGVITTADGTTEKNVWGKPSNWSDYTGTIKDAGQRGIAMFDHPSNLRHPVRWHIRGYGLNGANYFGLKDFEPNSGQKGEWTLENGKSQTFKYRVDVHSGDVTAANIAGLWEDYFNPATATVK